MTQCSYPKCNKKATVTLGMADPDCEQMPYCTEHAEEVRLNTLFGIFKPFSRRRK